MQLKRIFIDANILVSAVAFTGNERKLIKFALKGKIIPVFSDIVLTEARRVIDTKFPNFAPRLEHELALLEYELVHHIEHSLLIKAVELVRDPGDVEILAGILSTKPDYAVTGDKDLLTDEIRAIAPICRCTEFLDLMKSEEDNEV